MLVSGMIIGTMFTLFVVPSIYMLVAKTHVAISEEEPDADSQNLLPEPEDAAA
jgi:multidrug efflux pump